MKWYTKVSLVFGSMILAIVAFIIYDQLISGKIMCKMLAEGDFGKQQVLKFNIENPGTPHILEITPRIESGWGDPDVFISAILIDPNNNTLITIGKDVIFGGAVPGSGLMRSYSDYTKKFAFNPAIAGEYALNLTVLTEHIKNVHIAVSRKGK